MKTATALRPFAENVWLLPYPLKMLGVDLHRNVTIIRLNSGKLVIHSTAPFSPEDVAEIRSLGDPGWILDGILRHDTFAKEGREAFPQADYLAPEGFSEQVGFPTKPIVPAPMEWGTELLVQEIAGVPAAREVALFFPPSRTLILTEVIFNFPENQPLWTELLLRVAVGSEHSPGMPRPIKMQVQDKDAFRASLRAILEWDFERVIVGHGEPIETDAKAKVRAAFQAAMEGES